MNNNNLKNAFPNTPNNFKNRVRTTLDSLPEKEGYVKMNIKTYKNKSFKKRIVVAVAATFVLGTTAFAAGKLSLIVGSSSNIPTYKNIPSQEVMNKDFGFTPKLANEFKNGYEFKGGYAINKEGYDEGRNLFGKSKALNLLYKNKKAEINITVEDMTLIGEDEKSILVYEYATNIFLNRYIARDKINVGI
ncbi:MAG: hypothetical protein RSB77_05760 [Bacilli bacterium]